MSLALLGIATATPPHGIAQADAAALAASLGNEAPGVSGTLGDLYQRTRIRRRASVLLEDPAAGGPRQSFFPAAIGSGDGGPPTSARMAAYAARAGELATRAAAGALEASGIAAAQISHLVTCSCTGFANPGVDLELVAALGLPPEVSRTAIGFMGCHGAFNALRVAAAFAADPRHAVLVVPVELCSLHLQYGARPDLVVANAIFADGAAAVVGVGPGHRRGAGAWRVGRQWSFVVPDSRGEMGWAIGDHGFEMTLSPRVAALIGKRIRALVEGALAGEGLALADVGAWAVHPGGPRILDAVRTGLGLADDALLASETVLADHGNMSSATILFILRDLLASTSASRCVAVAFGPGLTVELALCTREPAAAAPPSPDPSETER